jgi:hypothetical protein
VGHDVCSCFNHRQIRLSRDRLMRRIRTAQGQFTDPEFESIAVRYFADPLLRNLPGPTQVERLMNDAGVTAAQQDWARAVAQRALTKVLLSTQGRRRIL